MFFFRLVQQKMEIKQMIKLNQNSFLPCTLHVLNPSLLIINPFQTYTIQGTPKDGGILPRSLDVLFNSIEGKHYTKMNLKPRFCTDVIRLAEDEERRENSYKNALISSLDKDVSLQMSLQIT